MEDEKAKTESGGGVRHGVTQRQADLWDDIAIRRG